MRSMANTLFTSALNTNSVPLMAVVWTGLPRSVVLSIGRLVGAVELASESTTGAAAAESEPDWRAWPFYRLAWAVGFCACF